MRVLTPGLTALKYDGAETYKMNIGRERAEINSGDVIVLDEVSAAMILRSRKHFAKFSGDLAVNIEKKQKPKKSAAPDKEIGQEPTAETETPLPPLDLIGG